MAFSSTAIAIWSGGRAAARSLAMGGYTLGTLAAVELTERIAHDREEALEAHKKRFCRDLLRIFGVRTYISDPVPSDPTRARLVVSNHRLVVDIPVLLGHFGGRVLSRADVATWPVLGRAAQKGDTIFVERDNRHSGAQAIRAIRRSLKAGQTVIVFPEGTTFIGDEVRPFHAGTFSAARGLDVDIVPVGLAFPPGSEYVNMTFAEHLLSLGRRAVTPCAMQVGPSFPASDDTRSTLERAQREVQELVHWARMDLDDRENAR